MLLYVFKWMQDFWSILPAVQREKSLEEKDLDLLHRNAILKPRLESTESLL